MSLSLWLWCALSAHAGDPEMTWEPHHVEAHDIYVHYEVEPNRKLHNRLAQEQVSDKALPADTGGFAGSLALDAPEGAAYLVAFLDRAVREAPTDPAEAEGWLEEHPLTARELKQEQGVLGKLGLSLEFS